MLSNKNIVLRNRAIRIVVLTFGIIFLVMVPNIRVLAKDSINKTQEDIYGIGSVSKMFTTVAVMKLADEGLIDLDSPLTEYIPEFHMADSRYVKITPRMLLNHSSGIMGTTFKNAFVYGNSDTEYHDSILDQLSTQKLKADPGAFCVYCNDGFTLAELLVERVSGLSFSEYVSREIADPLELKNTVTPGENLISKNVKPLYFGDKKLAYENVQLLGSGGIYSSPQDLCRFSQIFMKNGVPFLSDESLKEMETPYSLQSNISAGEGNSQYGYGLGWDSVNCYPYSQYGLKALSKGGSTTGYYTNLTVLPDNNLSIACSITGGDSILPELAVEDIILEVLKEEGIIDNIVPNLEKQDYEKGVIPKEWKKYEGYYYCRGIAIVKFIDNSTMIIKSMDNENPMELEFTYTTNGEFVSNKGGYMGMLGLEEPSNGNKGFTILRFEEEENGKTYMMGSLYEDIYGIGQSASTQPLGEKIERSKIDKDTDLAWQERDGKKYFMINEKYNSSNYLLNSSFKLERLKHTPEFLKHQEYVGACRIIDKDNAMAQGELPIMLGRDMADYHFYNKNNNEYLQLGSLTYISQDQLKESNQLLSKKEITINEDSKAIWYQISKQDSGKEIAIKAPENGAFYVYDKNNVCITSSTLQEDSQILGLPEAGYILLTGDKGAKFFIN